MFRESQCLTLTGWSNSPVQLKETDRQTDRQAGRQAGRITGRQADRQAGRQADKQAGRQAGRQTKTETETERQRETVDFHKRYKGNRKRIRWKYALYVFPRWCS